MVGKPPFHVSLVAVPGSLSSPITGLYEVLTAFPVVADFYDGVPPTSPFAVEIVGEARTTITAPSGLPITIQRPIEEIERTDIVIVSTMAVEGWETGRHRELIDWTRRMHARGALLCSACTGIVVLAETGLLDGGQATTHWSYARGFQRSFPRVELCIDEVLVTAGAREEFVMAGGAASWQDLALYLIGRFVSPAASQAIAKYELLERHTEGQTPYLPFSPRTQHGDSLVLGLQQWLETNFSVASPVAEMTRKASLSPRAFERRFRQATGYSPISYVQRIRVEEAKRRLERTDTSIDQISWDVGYEDAAAFRRLFKRIARVTPGAYRRKFKVPDFA
jgi:transcriptional regulator GlxA family with amidase domain